MSSKEEWVEDAELRIPIRCRHGEHKYVYNVVCWTCVRCDDMVDTTFGDKLRGFLDLTADIWEIYKPAIVTLGKSFGCFAITLLTLYSMFPMGEYLDTIDPLLALIVGVVYMAAMIIVAAISFITGMIYFVP